MEETRQTKDIFFLFNSYNNFICTVAVCQCVLMARTEKGKLLRDCASFLDDMFHRSLFSGIQIDLILGQNFKDGPQL